MDDYELEAELFAQSRRIGELESEINDLRSRLAEVDRRSEDTQYAVERLERG